MIDANQVNVITNSWGIYGEPTSPGKVKADEQAFGTGGGTRHHRTVLVR